MRKEIINDSVENEKNFDQEDNNSNAFYQDYSKNDSVERIVKERQNYFSGFNSIIDTDLFKSTNLLSNKPKLNTCNFIDMSYMFYKCSALISLPFMTEWKVDNVTDMSFMFYGCSSLITLPDISKWKINKVVNISYMFYECSSLISLPDITKWKAGNIEKMFYGCISLSSLPDLSKWDNECLKNVHNVFENCISLIFFPISNN